VDLVERNTWRQLLVPVIVTILLAILVSRLPQLVSESKVNNNTQSSLSNTIGMDMVLVPAGRFLMGSELQRGVVSQASEMPARQVKVRSFYLSNYEVTQAQWTTVMGYNPSLYKHPSKPVDQVSWLEVQEFIKKLNTLEGVSDYRLPSEAEWEYAARAGSSSLYSFGDDAADLTNYAWYGHVENVGTRPIGQRRPNAWGLYDMHGNVWEWVSDCWHDDYINAPTTGESWKGDDCSSRVLRGGGWNSEAPYLRSSARGSYQVDLNDVSNGFRLAKSP